MRLAEAPSPVQRLQAVIAARLGLRFEPRQQSWLAEVLARRSQACGDAPQHYLARLEQGPASAELATLATELTVGETYFFRHGEQFQALRLAVLPALIAARRPQRRLRVLSAGCASGEEAYSLAICLQAQLGLERSPWDWQVQAFDLNPQVLAHAAQARYGAWSLRELPEALREPWFEALGAEVGVTAAARRGVRFEQRNLCADDPVFWQPGAFDIVFCRNVLMYLTPEAMRAALARIAGALAPDGYLFLGHAESLREPDRQFDLRQAEGCFYYQPRAAPAPRPAPMPASMPTPTPATPAPPSMARQPPKEDAPHAALLELLRRERHDAALALATSLSATAPQDPTLLLPQALLLAQQGRLDAAESACERLLALRPDAAQRAATHYVQALCLEARDDAAGAELRYRQAIRLAPRFAMPRLRLGLLARRHGRLAQMREELVQAARLLRDEDEHHLLLFGGGFGRTALLALCEDGPRGAAV
ncbi:MAG TPA: CheR family methyltransferase [Roseateles sp.]|nr:CheR family methyltransferase [Roseateles sp.]